jgi:lysophospholipase L1-like esterase
MKNTPLLKKTRAESGPASAGVRIVHRICGITFLIAGLFVGSTTPAVAHYPEPLDYVAFGDSYTAGIGAGPAQPSPTYGAQCFQATPPGYVEVLDSRDDVDLTTNAACGGAPAAVVPAQVGAAAGRGLLNADTDLVTITAGGNDVNFGGILAACRKDRPLDECKATVKVAEDVARTEVLPALTNAYAAIRAQAPNATIVALGYPHLFSPEFGDNAFTTQEAAKVFNKGTDTLNRVIRKAAKQFRGAEYVDVVDEFEGHGIGSPNPWINFTGNPSDIANFHPNETGYAKGYARAIVREAGIRGLVH